MSQNDVQVEAAAKVIRLEAALAASPESEVAAWLKQWVGPDGEKRSRVDLKPDIELWLSHYNPTVTPLYAAPPSQALRDKVEVLEAALKPFAEIAEAYDEAEDDGFEVWKDFDTLGSSLPLRNFRKARAALNTGEPKQ